MNTWLEISRQLLVLIPVSLFFVALALFLFDGLRSVVYDLRAWIATKRTRLPEEAAVDAISQYQGAFHLNNPSGVRQRFGHQYEIQFRNHWGCQGKWVRKWEVDG